jgi:hypothetical protein
MVKQSTRKGRRQAMERRTICIPRSLSNKADERVRTNFDGNLSLYVRWLLKQDLEAA